MKRAVADLFWRVFEPSLSDAWDAGYKACRDDNGGFDPHSERSKTTNPYRNQNPFRR